MSDTSKRRLAKAASEFIEGLRKAELPAVQLAVGSPKIETNDNGGWWSPVGSWKGHPSIGISLDRYPSSSRLTFWAGFWSYKWEPLRKLFEHVAEPAAILKNADSAETNGIWILDPPLPETLHDSPIAERYSAEKYYGCYQSRDQFNVGRAVEFVSRAVIAAEKHQDQRSIDIDLINRRRLSPARKKVLILARCGQGQFRTNVIRIWKCCPLSQHAFPTLLRASHIVPWAEARTDEERLNPYNGILLSANLDALFDRHLISFDKRGRLVFSKRLDQKEIDRLGIYQNRIVIHDRSRPFLDRHWTRFQQKQKL